MEQLKLYIDSSVFGWSLNTAEEKMNLRKLFLSFLSVKKNNLKFVFLILIALLFLFQCSSKEKLPLTYQQIVSGLSVYKGESNKGVNSKTLKHKVMCGYQGWFTAEGDGAKMGWFHYRNKGDFKPGYCSIDIWPDMSEMDDDEKYPTPFKHKDGSTAYVFSSYNKKTVIRHFKWMKDYGIDGVFVQRFGTVVSSNKPRYFNHSSAVLNHCREGANIHGRVYAVMYDISGLDMGEISVVINDWKVLKDKMNITGDNAYLHHKGKPVVAVWGIGFSGRSYTLDECMELVEFLKNDKKYGNNIVMLGLPTFWRTLKYDSVADKKLHDIIKKADIVSPWMVGRVNYPDCISYYAKILWKPDMAWCRKYKKEYLPVTFPGFSWNNMFMNNPRSNPISRLKGQFLWQQYYELKKIGVNMIYQAMFDEIDEGTAIFKCTDNPPVGKSKFITYEGLPSDYYLWLVGKGGQLLRGELELSQLKNKNFVLKEGDKQLPALIDYIFPSGIGTSPWNVMKRTEKSPIVIDGDLKDWPIAVKERAKKFDQKRQLIEGRDLWDSSDDFSASLYMMWDKDYFYISLEVKDDKHIQKYKNEDLYKGDSLYVSFDTKGNAKKAGYDKDDHEYAIALSSDDVIVWHRIESGNDKMVLNKNIKCSIVRKKNITVYEMAFPKAELEGIEMIKGKKLGFNILLWDSDDKELPFKKAFTWTKGRFHIIDPAEFQKIKLI